jgi:hypothetical protein
MRERAYPSADRFLCLTLVAGIALLGGALCSARPRHHGPTKSPSSRVVTVGDPSEDVAEVTRPEGKALERFARYAATDRPRAVRIARTTASDIGFDPIPVRHRKIPVRTDSADPPH